MRNFRFEVDDMRARRVQPPAPPVDYDGPDFVSDLRTLSAALLSRRLLVAACTAGALLLGLAYVWIATPVYTSTAEVLIDPRQRAVFEQEIVPGGMGQSSLGADTFLLDSQVEVILSQSILHRLIDELDLVNDPDLGASGGGGVVGGLIQFILRGPRANAHARSPEDRVMETLFDDLDVRRKGNTYVLAVSMKSENPVTSAVIANRLTEIYMEEINAYTRAKITDVEELLGGRLAELRAAALASQSRVEAYRAENGLLSAESLTVVEQQLRDLNQQLSLVATATNAARARWEEVARLQGQPVDALLGSGALDSPLLNTLREQFSSLSAREASLSATLAGKHPTLQAVRDSMASVRVDMNREVDRLVSRHKVEYDVAIANEESIRAQIASLERAMASSNRAGVTLRDLEREAESDAAIYQQFLTRSKDAREQVNLPTEAVRVISRAQPEFRPVWPKPILVLAAALMVGFGGGMCLALVLHLFSTPARPAAPRSLLGEARA